MYIDMTYFIEILAIIAFLILLVAAIMMVAVFYWCDNSNCKAFNEANENATPGTKDYALILLSETYADGLWPLPYIGAAILTPLSLWFIGIPLTIKNFAILFVVSFLVIYFIAAFFAHHYIKPITTNVSNYIDSSCDNSSSLDIAPSLDLVDNPSICTSSNLAPKEKKNFNSFREEFGITFATPVDIYI